APENGRRFGDDWRAVSVGSTDVYLRRYPRESKWQLVAVVHHAAPSSGSREWRAEYGAFEAGLPRSVRLTSAPDDRFDLRLTLSQVELNARLGPEVFQVDVPPGAEPMTLEELKRSGPFGAGRAGGAGGAGGEAGGAGGERLRPHRPVRLRLRVVPSAVEGRAEDMGILGSVSASVRAGGVRLRSSSFGEVSP